MSLTERSSEHVRQTVERLEADHGGFPVVDDEWTVAVDAYETDRERFEADTVGGAGVWLHDDSGAVLLVREVGASGWSEPAGKHEPGESLEETARRELTEETGVTGALTGVALAQRVTVHAPDRPPLVRLIVTFSAEYTGGSLSPADDEIAEVRWWDERPPVYRYDALDRLPIPVDG